MITAIEHWNYEFVGISGIAMAEKLDIEHSKALDYFKQLRDENKGSLRENVKLYPITFFFDDKGNFIKKHTKEITTSIFFPSKEVLTDYYDKNLRRFIEEGEFKKRLRKGYSQLHLFFFDIKVLKKYLDHLEIYEIDDDVTGGRLGLNSDFLATLSESKQDEVFFDKVRYGKRKLKDGNISVCAILNDLANMPKNEQSYWLSFEIENPILSDADSDFTKFFLRDFGGEWIESDDPLRNIKMKIKSINKIFKDVKFFLQEENPYLCYPVSNNLKNYCDCNKELFKLIGSDNLNLKVLKRLLELNLNYRKENFINKKTNRPLSKLQLLNVLLDSFESDEGNEFRSIYKTIQNGRVHSSHKITTPQMTDINYIDVFRQNCYQLYNALVLLEHKLLKLEIENN